LCVNTTASSQASTTEPSGSPGPSFQVVVDVRVAAVLLTGAME
jgi:hypothetical protein